MTRVGRRVGLLTIGALAVLTAVIGAIMAPTLMQSIVLSDYSGLPEGTEVLSTRSDSEVAAGFAFWGPAFLVAALALATAVFVVALRWPRRRDVPPAR